MILKRTLQVCKILNRQTNTVERLFSCGDILTLQAFYLRLLFALENFAPKHILRKNFLHMIKQQILKFINVHLNSGLHCQTVTQLKSIIKEFFIFVGLLGLFQVNEDFF